MLHFYLFCREFPMIFLFYIGDDFMKKKKVKKKQKKKRPN